MEDIKVFRLYKALSREEKKEFQTWMLGQYRGVFRYRFYSYVKTYLELDNLNRNISWKEWIKTQQGVKINKLNDYTNNLREDIENFLLIRFADMDTKLLREIELFYIYRSLGLDEDNLKRVKDLSHNIPQTTNRYIHYIYSQFRAEVNTNVYHETNLLEDVFKNQNLDWVSEYLFMEISRLSKNVPHPSFPLEDVRSFIEHTEYLKNNVLITFYLKMLDFCTLQDWVPETISMIFEEMKTIQSLINKTRRRNLFGVFINKVNRLLRLQITYSRIETVFSFYSAGLEDNLFTAGKTLSFPTYYNYFFYISALYHNNPVRLKAEIQKMEKKYRHLVYFHHEEMEMIMDSLILWRTGKDTQKVPEINSAKITDPLYKSIFILLQMKCSLDFYREAPVQRGDILEKLSNKFRKMEYGNFHRDEYDIWGHLLNAYSGIKPAESKAFLKNILLKYEESDLFLSDKTWYLARIKESIGHL